MATGLELLTDSLQEIGVLAVGETPNSDMANHALDKGNRMLSGWANQGRKVYEIKDEDQTMAASTQEYTIGSGGTWDTNRPTKIYSITLRTSANYDYNMKEYSAKEWMDIRDKSVETNIPRYWYYDKTFPLGIVKFYPIPSGTVTARILSLKQFTALTLAGSISLPPGYEELIISHLALKLCPGYKVKITPDLKLMAWESLNGIKQINKKHDERSVDDALVQGRGGLFDINTGTYL